MRTIRAVIQDKSIWAVGVALLTSACGQNAHVTQSDPSLVAQDPGPVVKSSGTPTTSTTFPPGAGGGGGGGNRPNPPLVPKWNPVAPKPRPEGCIKQFKSKYPVRAITREECRGMEFPYLSRKYRTLRSKTVLSEVDSQSRCGCDSVKDTVQLVFSSDVTGLPPRMSVTQVNRVALEMKVVRNYEGVDGTELFCLLDERVCSGMRDHRGVNWKFWSTVSSSSKSTDDTVNRYFTETLRDETMWKKRSCGYGSFSNAYVVEFEELLRGSIYDLEGILYANGTSDRTFRMVIADDMEACSGEIVVDLEYDSCAADAIGDRQ